MPDMVNIALVPVEGDLDVTSVPVVRARIDRLVERGCRRLLVNLSEASHVDSAGMGLILTEVRRLRSIGGLLSLVNVSPQVYRSLRRMRVLVHMPVLRACARRSPAPLDPTVLPEWRLTFRVDADGLSEARGRLGELLAPLPLTDDQAFDMTLAVGEALGNAVDHTCGSGVLVTVASYPDRVFAEVTDCGKGYEAPCDEELPAVGPLAERGRGVRLMRLLVDSVSIERKSAGEGTVVRLVKLYDRPGAFELGEERGAQLA